MDVYVTKCPTTEFKGRSIPKDKKLMIATLLIASVAASILYYAAISYLVSSYSTSYQQLPEIMKMSHGSSALLISSLSAGSKSPIKWLESLLAIYNNPTGYILLAMSIFIVFLGFGIFTVYRPKITLILLLTWFFVVIFGGFAKALYYIYPGLYGYSYTIGSTFAAAVIGAISISNKPKELWAAHRYIMASSTILIALTISLFTLLISAAPLIFLINYHNPNPLTAYNATDINQLSGMIPQNASLFTLNFIAPHVAERRYLEFPATEQDTNSFFVPDYILVATSNVSELSSNNVINGNFGYLISNYRYGLYAKEGDARLYVLDDAQDGNISGQYPYP